MTYPKQEVNNVGNFTVLIVKLSLSTSTNLKIGHKLGSSSYKLGFTVPGSVLQWVRKVPFGCLDDFVRQQNGTHAD